MPLVPCEGIGAACLGLRHLLFMDRAWSALFDTHRLYKEREEGNGIVDDMADKGSWGGEDRGWSGKLL